MNGSTWGVHRRDRETQNRSFWGERGGQQKVLLPLPVLPAKPQRGILLQITQAKQGRWETRPFRSAEGILRQRREVPYGEKNNFDIKTAGEFIQQFDSITTMVGLIAIAISSLGLTRRRHRRNQYHACFVTETLAGYGNKHDIHHADAADKQTETGNGDGDQTDHGGDRIELLDKLSGGLDVKVVFLAIGHFATLTQNTLRVLKGLI